MLCACACVYVCGGQAMKAKEQRGEEVAEEKEPLFVDYPMPEMLAPDGSVIGQGGDEDGGEADA